MGCKQFFLKEKKNVTFFIKIDLPNCLVVFFVVCPRLRSFWSVFGELALFWCHVRVHVMSLGRLWSSKTLDTQMAMRVSRLRRSRARALLSLNLKKKRDCSQSIITIFLVSFNLQSSCLMQSAVCSLQSAVCGLRSAVCGLRSAVCGLRSAVCSLQMSYTVGLFVDVVFCQEPVSVLKTSSYHPQTLFL